MSKVYALSGLRAAYLVTASAEAAELRRWTPPWALSLPAQLAAIRALEDPDYYRARREETRGLRSALAAGLRSVGDLEVRESVANFVLVTLPRRGPSATELCRRSRARGLFLRDLTSLSPAFEGRTVRIAVRGGPEQERMLEVIEEVLEKRR